ncbi:Pre-mRNA-splicing factor 38B [Hondaea fermentalgiana]|uniref:Pre-mRNA-splicing factor 38 n=1 Tax=Hondaea fermentalgiana TaxID=2315210 RepID=A0A2R5GKE8_9STRA|nr:Pre-mRNA-splicing factor 38B [Hondaea fermentalgiana]|eukprot:GBG28344.1 Pre-mRNA-splicing factor 38B [Hondaea fermentalgiana]
MSRAAEAFKLRKEVRQAQQQGQAAATGRFGRGEDGAGEAHDTLQTQPQVAVKNLVPVKMDGNFNLGPMLARKVQASEYYRSLRQLTTTAPQLVDEVRHNVRSLDPWLKTSSGDAGTAFCALYRLCELRPTRKQLSGMLTQQGAPFVRALGFLFVRFVCPPDQVWDWLRPFFMDDEQFRPLMEADKPWTMGLWLESLLVEHKFAGIVLPRFPYTVDEDLRVRVGGLRAERARFARNLSERDRFVVGAKIEALYADDGKWYDAEVMGPGQTSNSFLVRYTAYGNEEEVSLGAMRQPGAADLENGLENVSEKGSGAFAPTHTIQRI